MSNGDSVLFPEPRNPRAPYIATCAEPNNLLMSKSACAFNNERDIREPSSRVFYSRRGENDREVRN